ncbi:amidase family protein [Acrocarpospora catenulata]|uniref:amidase family protein n=1 Tax=Acrocarpospora catenulata TaxID=2836182 RepID=UPI001BD98336|nr:amidase family protein [Acrocarpospora catenulata]
MSSLDTATAASAALARGELSPAELTEHLLTRIEATEPYLNAYATVTAGQARARAAELGRRERHGPTHNPYRRGRIPGGSSGGSAASVAAGSCLGALGSDTAGAGAGRRDARRGRPARGPHGRAADPVTAFSRL